MKILYKSKHPGIKGAIWKYEEFDDESGRLDGSLAWRNKMIESGFIFKRVYAWNPKWHFCKWKSKEHWFQKKDNFRWIVAISISILALFKSYNCSIFPKNEKEQSAKILEMPKKQNP